MAEQEGRCCAPAESGVALVEAALALVVAVALLAGVSVVGREWGGGTQAEQLATRAARLAARLTDPVTSDLDILAFVEGGLGGATLERLVVYRPDGVEGAPSPACLGLQPTGIAPAGVAGACTAFGPGHLEALADAPVSARGCGPQSWEASWCPALRRSEAGTPAWVGVLVEVHRPGGAGAGGAEAAIHHSARAVAALDPAPRGRP